MTGSFTISESQTFTVTHARHMAAKVAADLKRMQRYYGSSSDTQIAKYEAEVIALLKAGYLGTVWYGFERGGKWIEPSLKYTAHDLMGLSANDDDPGKVQRGKDVTGASFYSYLTYSAQWDKLSFQERDTFKKTLPYYRGGADEPGIDGYLEDDRTYSSGGRALNRACVRGY